MSTKVGKDTSLPKRGVYFPTLQKLLKQREALDRQILRLQGRLFKTLEQRSLVPESKKHYVARMQNTTILRNAILQSMVPGCKMTMDAILKALRRKKLYHTQSGYFYTMVNNKLNSMVKEGIIEKTSRGVFTLKKAGRKRKRAS